MPQLDGDYAFVPPTQTAPCQFRKLNSESSTGWTTDGVDACFIYWSGYGQWHWSATFEANQDTELVLFDPNPVQLFGGTNQGKTACATAAAAGAIPTVDGWTIFDGNCNGKCSAKHLPAFDWPAGKPTATLSLYEATAKGRAFTADSLSLSLYSRILFCSPPLSLHWEDIYALQTLSLPRSL